MEKKAKQGIMWYSADFEFLIQLCIKNAFFGVPCRNITTMCRNIAFFEVRAEILLTWDQGVPGFSCRAIFGVREEILIFRRNIHLCPDSTKYCCTTCISWEIGYCDIVILWYYMRHHLYWSWLNCVAIFCLSHWFRIPTTVSFQK